MISLKLLAATLVTLLGIFGVGCELALGKGPFSKAQDILETLVSTPIDHYVEKKEVAVKVQPRPETLENVKTHEPSMMASMCEKAMPMVECRLRCEDLMCLATCPRVECPRLREKLEARSECKKSQALVKALATAETVQHFQMMKACPDPLNEIKAKCTSAFHPVEAAAAAAAVVPVPATKPEVVAEIAQTSPVSEPATKQDWMAKKCEELKPIMHCHMSCGHDHDCHTKCPMPNCPRMKAKVEEAIACHGACSPGDRQCHHACPKPLYHMAWKCRVGECLKACPPGGDADECRRKCGASMEGFGAHHGHFPWHHGHGHGPHGHGHHGFGHWHHGHGHHGHGHHGFHHPYFPSSEQQAAGPAESPEAVSSRRAGMD